MTNPASLLRSRLPRVLLALLALAAALAMATATPVGATEATEEATPVQEDVAAEEGGAAEGESGKVTISDNPHDQFGLILFALMGLAAVAMGVNMVQQLRGARPQADGKIRWR